MTVGIEHLAFSTSRYFIKLETLAAHRGVDYKKYSEGIGQRFMSVFPPNEDIVTIAVDAAAKILVQVEDINSIDMLLFATESAFDLAKSIGIYVHRFLNLREDCRVVDLKQACYSATAALQLAKTFVQANPHSRVLVLGSDVVKYSPNSSGEPTQGGAAVAFIVSANPKIMVIEDGSGIHTQDVMDFWRPATSKEALFDGRLSAYCYLRSLGISFDRYLKNTGLQASDVDCMCFHTPFCKIARKGMRQLVDVYGISPYYALLDNSLDYASLLGNSCSASLYICLLSLLDNAETDLAGKRVGLYSYGSGSVAEYFSVLMCDSYKTMLTSQKNRLMLESRIEVSFEEYEKFCQDLPPKEYSSYDTTGRVRLKSIENMKRIYEAIA
jgi:hydroxymethylglutaryl-CoA synthase